MPQLSQCCALKCKLSAIKYYLVSCILLVYLKYTLIGYFYRVFSTLLLPSYVTCYANACKMCEVFCFFFQPEVASSCTCVAVYVCECVYVCASWPVATRSPRSVAFVTILNVSPGRQNEAKLAPIVATSVWLDIFAARTLVCSDVCVSH